MGWGRVVVVLELYIAAVLVFIGLFLVYHRLGDLERTSHELKNRLNDLKFDPIVASEGILIQIEELITGTLGDMRMPSGLDHVGGAIAGLIQTQIGILQAKAMAAMGQDPFAEPMIEENVD